MLFSISRRAGNAQRSGSRALFSLILTLGLSIALLLVGCGLIRRQINMLSGDAAESKLNRAIAQAMKEAVSETGDVYPEPVRISYGEGGAVTSIETVTEAISYLTDAFLAHLTAITEKTGSVSIPIGNLTGLTVLSGRGVPFRFKTVLSDAVSTSVRSEFVSVGINQTLHRLLLDCEVSVTVLLPGENCTRTVTGAFPIAETVIIGQVPDVYLS